MSDLAKAVFKGQLLGKVIAGEELSQSVITDAAFTADLADGIALSSDSHMSEIEQDILESKVAQSVLENGNYSSSEIIVDQLESGTSADFVEDIIG